MRVMSILFNANKVDKTRRREGRQRKSDELERERQGHKKCLVERSALNIARHQTSILFNANKVDKMKRRKKTKQGVRCVGRPR